MPFKIISEKIIRKHPADLSSKKMMKIGKAGKTRVKVEQSNKAIHKGRYD